MSTIHIVGIDTDNIGQPANDGTRGSALYKVPIKLSARPSADWAELLPRTWDNPPRFTTMHRPGIAYVSGDCIVLDGTTVEEIEQYHRDTLLGVVDAVNEQVTQIEARRHRAEAARRDAQAAHDAQVRDVASRVQF